MSFSSCKTSATVPPLLQRSGGGRRGQFNNFVESATVSLPRVCCERGVCGQRIAGTVGRREGVPENSLEGVCRCQKVPREVAKASSRQKTVPRSAETVPRCAETACRRKECFRLPQKRMLPPAAKENSLSGRKSVIRMQKDSLPKGRLSEKYLLSFAVKDYSHSIVALGFGDMS